MKQSYRDITDKLGTPLWWDEHGVPRYEPFRPELASNVYAKQVAFLEIACQACREKFKVCISYSSFHQQDDLKKRIKNKSIHYGDPPNYYGYCCASGPTINCEDLVVLEFWERVYVEWVRHKEFEIDLLS